jgi:hypothetical protein
MAIASKVENELKDQIKKYVSVDNYIKQEYARLAEYRTQKKTLENNILHLIKTHDIPNVEINLPDGSLQCIEKETHSALNQTFLKNAFVAYFSEKTNNMIKATQEAEELLDFVLKQRETRKESGLRRVSRRKKIK